MCVFVRAAHCARVHAREFRRRRRRRLRTQTRHHKYARACARVTGKTAPSVPDGAANAWFVVVVVVG